MTEAAMKAIKHGQTPLTPEAIEEVLAETRAAITAATSGVGQISVVFRLHDFITSELRIIVEQRSLESEVTRRVNYQVAPDERTAMKEALGISG